MTLLETRSDAVSRPLRGRLVPGRTRTRVLAAVAIIVLAAGIVPGAVLWNVSASYSPLRTAGWFGSQSGSPVHVAPADPRVGYRIIGPAGTAQEFEFALVNDGSHPVTITGIDPAKWAGHGRHPVSGIVWAPYRDMVGGLLSGRPSRSGPFPAHLAAHGILKVRFTVTKPDCPPPDGSDFGVSLAMRVHWKAMINSHTSVINPAPEADGVVLCGG